MTEATQEFKLPMAGAEHEKMKPFEGKFKSTVKMWMDPTQEPHISTGTMNCKWHLNDLYLNQDYVGDAVDGPFPNFEGKGYWGYNTTAECYEGFWIDTVSSAMQMETGQVDSSGKVWEMFSNFTCPQTKQEMKKRTVITLTDNDHNKMECFFQTPDGEVKAMEIEYVRT